MRVNPEVEQFARAFLRRLHEGARLNPADDRREDKARQYCRRHGWARFSRKTDRWEITDAGISVLKATIESGRWGVQCAS
jgi:hypothetical protein